MKLQVHQVGADWMGYAFATDRDLQLPARPKLIPELLVLPYDEDGLLFVGGEHEQVIRGRSTRAVLPRLLPLLDGRKTLEELAYAFPKVSANNVRGIISLLYSRGLVEDGAAVHPQPARFADVQSFLGRHIDVSRVHCNREAAFAALAGASVGIYGTPELAALLVDQLRATGIGDVCLGWAPASQVDRTLHVIVSTGADTQGKGDRWDGTGRLFLVRLGRHEFHVGPLLVPHITACYRCFTHIHPPPGGAPDDLLARYWLGLTAVQIAHVLTRLAMPKHCGNFHVFWRDANGDLRQQTRCAPRMPGCQQCGLKGPVVSPTDRKLIPWIYHWSTALPSREGVTPKAHQMHYLGANLELAKEEKSPLFPGQSLPLPPPLPLGNGLPWMTASREKTVASVNVGQLATLLKWTAGEVRDNGLSRRLAPTGGNLGSVDLWVVARHIEGLRQGIYHYHAPRHALEYAYPLPAGDDPMATALGEYGPRPPGLVVGTGALAKCAQKYGAFAYRLIHLDSGVALAYLYNVAAALGIGLREYANYDEVAMAYLLGIPTRWEFPLPTFAVGICPPDETATRGQVAVPASIGGGPDRIIRGLTPQDYSDEVLTRLLEAVAESPAPLMTMTEVPRQIPRCRVPVVTDTLEQVLLSRRAIRDYRSLDIPGPVLQALMAITAQILENRLAATGRRCPVQPLLAVVQASPPLEPGLYDIATFSGALHKRAPFSPVLMRDCTNQEALATSPAALFLVGDIGAAVESCGPRGYRMLVQHAGAAVGQAWLAATAFGLGGSAAGGIIAGGLQRAAAIDGYQECPLLAFHMGYQQSAGLPQGQFV